MKYSSWKTRFSELLPIQKFSTDGVVLSKGNTEVELLKWGETDELRFANLTTVRLDLGGDDAIAGTQCLVLFIIQLLGPDANPPIWLKNAFEQIHKHRVHEEEYPDFRLRFSQSDDGHHLTVLFD